MLLRALNSTSLCAWIAKLWKVGKNSTFLNTVCGPVQQPRLVSGCRWRYLGSEYLSRGLKETQRQHHHHLDATLCPGASHCVSRTGSLTNSVRKRNPFTGSALIRSDRIKCFLLHKDCRFSDVRHENFAKWHTTLRHCHPSLVEMGVNVKVVTQSCGKFMQWKRNKTPYPAKKNQRACNWAGA